MKKKILIFFILLAYSCCASSRTPEKAPIQMKYEFIKHTKRTGKKETTSKNAPPCNIEVFPIIDDRQNKATLGEKVNSHPILASGLENWLSDVLKDLEYDLEHRENTSATIRMQPYLTRMYANHKHSNLFGTVALRLEYYQDDKQLDVAYARGYSVALNFADGNGEYISLLNEAMHKALIEVKEATDKICDGL